MNTNAVITNFSSAPMEFSFHSVISADGTKIGYRQIGKGAGLVVMHGGLRASQHYERLARALADQFTVYIPDRRGRGLSGPAGENYSYVTEVEDLDAILQKTGARMVFGHSGGGLFALEAALKLSIDKMVLYEPAVSINGSLPLGWLSELDEAINRKDYAEAMVKVIQGLPLNWMSKMPHWALYPLFSLMLRGKQGAEIAELLSTGSREGREALRLDSTYQRYRVIKTETLLLGGAKSPAFLLNILSVLTETLPHAKMMVLPNVDHTAPDEDAPETVAAVLKPFLLPNRR